MKMASGVKRILQANETRRARGRPRSTAARAAILHAAAAILDEGGATSLTMEGVAERAGVGKPTLYRYWRNAQELAMAALIETQKAPAAARATASALGDLRLQLRKVAAVFASRVGRHVAMMVAAADEETEVSKVFRTHFILARREEGRALLQKAAAQGMIRNDLDLEVALDMIYGPLFYRLLVGHKPLTAEFTDALLTRAIEGLAGKGGPR
jgi:AcrR family transcriptional regulator